MGKASKSAFGLPVGSLKLFMESLPRPAKCTKNNLIFSNRYILIPRTSKYPEKLLKLWKLCGKLPFLWWLGGSRIYMCFCLEKNICPWRHSNCWLPNSFILGGGTHSKFRNAGKMQFFSFARVECRFQVRILSFSPSIYVTVFLFVQRGWRGICCMGKSRTSCVQSPPINSRFVQTEGWLLGKKTFHFHFSCKCALWGLWSLRLDSWLAPTSSLFEVKISLWIDFSIGK